MERSRQNFSSAYTSMRVTSGWSFNTKSAARPTIIQDSVSASSLITRRTSPVSSGSSAEVGSSKHNILGFNIYTLPASHDSPGTTGFLIEYNDEKMAYITDTGYIHENIQRIINNCDIYCIESNHDPRLLMLTKRPMFLKNRILSSSGHLSNQDCSYVLGNVIGPKTKQIVFLHRSQEANSEDMVNQTFISTMNKMGVNVSNIDTKIARASEVVVLENIKV